MKPVSKRRTAKAVRWLIVLRGKGGVMVATLTVSDFSRTAAVKQAKALLQSIKLDPIRKSAMGLSRK